MGIEDGYFHRKASGYADSIIDAACASDKHAVIGLLKLFAKEVHKDTRHKAADISHLLHAEIMNMNMDEP